MDFTIEYTPKDYFQIQKAHYGSSFTKKAITAIGIFCILSGIYLLLTGIADVSTFTTIIIGIIFLFFDKLVLESRFKNDFKKSKYLHGPLKYTLNKDGMISSNKYMETKSTWDCFINIKITKKVILLYRGPNVITGFPKHYFKENEWQKLTGILKDNIKK